jgi:Domain of unknown function (DUF4115)
LVEPLKPKERQKPNVAAIAIIGWVTGVILWLGGACWYLGSSEPVPSQQTPESGSGPSLAAQTTSQVPTAAAQSASQVPDVPADQAGAPGVAFGPPAVTPVSGGVTVGVAATTDARLRVTVDSRVEFEGTLAAGEQQAWDGRQRIQVWTDSGRTLLLAVNGHDLGPYSSAMGHPDWNSIEFGFWPGWTR